MVDKVAKDQLKEAFFNSIQAGKNISIEHDKLRASEKYQSELSFLKSTIVDLIHTLRLAELAASRWQEFGLNYLLPRHFDDIVEAALTAQLAIENGALNPARRELRFMLEVAVNVAYVDEVRSNDSYEERVSFYRSKKVKKSNVDQVSELPLRMFDEHNDEFRRIVKKAWVKASNYVHLSKRKIDEKLRLREAGITLGLESVEMLEDIVADVNEVSSIVIALTFETIGPAITGDLLVSSLDEIDEWAFHANGLIAFIDSQFDHKSERINELDEIKKRRKARIRYEFNPTSD